MAEAATKRRNLLALIGPGMLVAATGVGAGDLATGAFTGSRLGTAVLWAVLLGAVLKFAVTEGLARWQLATGETLLEGAMRHFGPIVHGLFFIYLLVWSFWVGTALMSACGVTAHAVFPGVLREPVTLIDPETGETTTLLSGKIVFGLAHSLVAAVLVWFGGYRLFEKVMGVCIAVMFATVVATAIATGPAASELARGLFYPTIPDADGEGLQWTVALMGGVGGTLTVLCYGYWIREEKREGIAHLRDCRIDLATGYTMTALFGLAMVVIGSRFDVQQKGARLIVQLADQLEAGFPKGGIYARWAFLIGAWGAVSSSLLGVWQSVPYLFADFWQMIRRKSADRPKAGVDTRSRPYRAYLCALATIPAVGLWHNFETVQKVYAIIGAAFIPMLAVVLLVMNGRSGWVGRQNRNSPLTVVFLLAGVLFFLLAGWFEVQNRVFR